MKEPTFYKIVRGPLNAFFKGVYKPEYIGLENIPESGRIILAGNHTNYFDCLLVSGATKELFTISQRTSLSKARSSPYLWGWASFPSTAGQRTITHLSMRKTTSTTKSSSAFSPRAPSTAPMISLCPSNSVL